MNFTGMIIGVEVEFEEVSAKFPLLPGEGVEQSGSGPSAGEERRRIRQHPKKSLPKQTSPISSHSEGFKIKTKIRTIANLKLLELLKM